MSLAAQLQNYPALPPPPGVKSNFDNPVTQDAALIKVNAVFIALMLPMIVIRIYSKAFISHTLWWDDYTCIVAAIGSVLNTIIMMLNLKLGYGRHLWDIRAISLTPPVIRQLSSISVLYPIVIFSLKLSILLLYLRIFKVDKLFRRLIYLGIVFQGLFYFSILVVSVATVILCSSANPLSYRVCTDSNVIVVVSSVFNMATDFYVLALPIARVSQLQIKFRQKIGLCALFLTGLAACAVSLARLIVAALQIHDPDNFWKAVLNSELTVIEMNMGIIAACMTALPAFFRNSKIFNLGTYSSLRSRLFGTRDRSKDSNSRGWTNESSSKKWDPRFAHENSSYRHLHDENSLALGEMAPANANANAIAITGQGGGLARDHHDADHVKGGIVRTVDYTVV